MPTLGQPDASIYSDIQLPKPLNIGGPMQQSARQAGPNAAMERLAGEQQKDQQIQSLAQQYGDDYDGLVKAVTTLDPERGLKMQQTLSEARKTEAQNRLAQTESSLKSMTWVEDGVKLAIQDPTQYPKLLQSLAKQPGGSQFLQYAPDPNDPDLKAKLQNLLPVFVDTKDFQKVSQQSYRDYLNGDLELSAVRKLAAADTPDKRQLVDSELKGAGLSDYSKQYPDAASASQAFTALVAQKQQEKPSAEKEGSDFKQYAAKVARDMGKTYDDLTSADMDKIRAKYSKDMVKPAVVNMGAPGAMSDVKETVAGMIDGTLPPVLPGRATKEYNAIMAESHRQKFDLAKAAQDWQATTKYLGTLNGQQQTRLRQAVEQVQESVPLVRSLVTEWDSAGVPALSSANLKAAKAGAYGNKAQSLANRLDAQIADMTSELGTVYKGGNSSTDESLKLADKNLHSDWSKQAALDALDQIEQNIKYRKNSMKLGPVTDGNNRYAPDLGGPQPTSTGPKVGERRNFNGKIGEWDGKGWKAVQ